MKHWALVFIFVATVLPFSKAEAKEKTSKRKVVEISFSEEDARRQRAPASVDEKQAQAAEARHIARLSQVDWNNLPEM